MANDARIPARKREKHTGRSSKPHSFIQIPLFILESDEFEALPGGAVKMLLDLAKQHNGRNNGDLSMPWVWLRKHGWTSQGTAHRAKQALLKSKFVITTRHGGKHVCSLYGITWWAMADCGGKTEVAAERVASHLWKKPNP